VQGYIGQKNYFTYKLKQFFLSHSLGQKMWAEDLQIDVTAILFIAH
jgi:hypothetical protein